MDENTQKTLSLIYTTLASSAPVQAGLSSSSSSSSALGGETGGDRELEEIKKAMPPIDKAALQELEEAFTHVVPCYFPTMDKVYPRSNSPEPITEMENSLHNLQKIERMRELYEAEMDLENSLSRSIQQKLKERRVKQREEDLKRADSFKMSTKLATNKAQIEKLQTMCRDMQMKSKEAETVAAKLLASEEEKSRTFEKDCSESIGNVLAKIEDEQREIDVKARENEDLRGKLEKFKENLDLMRAREENEKRMIELSAQLDEARKAQREHDFAQQKVRENKAKANLRHQEEVIHKLKTQIKFFNTKFKEFDSAIAQTTAIISTLDEKEALMLKQLGQVEEYHGLLAKQSKNEDVRLIKVMERVSALQAENKGLGAQFAKNERACRDLQAVRLQQRLLLEDKGDREESTPAIVDGSSSSSSSSSSSGSSSSSSGSSGSSDSNNNNNSSSSSNNDDDNTVEGACAEEASEANTDFDFDPDTDTNTDPDPDTETKRIQEALEVLEDHERADLDDPFQPSLSEVRPTRLSAKSGNFEATKDMWRRRSEGSAPPHK